MRRLSVALQIKGNAMTFDAYCEWRNTRDLLLVFNRKFLIYNKLYVDRVLERSRPAFQLSQEPNVKSHHPMPISKCKAEKTTNSILHRNIPKVTEPQKLHARTLTN
jgi:hypothetical protein